jgi:hypothetical protein
VISGHETEHLLLATVCLEDGIRSLQACQQSVQVRYIPNFFDGTRVSPYSLVSDASTDPPALNMMFRNVAGLG